MPVAIDGLTLLIFNFTATTLVGVLASALGIVFDCKGLVTLNCLKILSIFLILFALGVVAAVWRVGDL